MHYLLPVIYENKQFFKEKYTNVTYSRMLKVKVELVTFLSAYIKINECNKYAISKASSSIFIDNSNLNVRCSARIDVIEEMGSNPPKKLYTASTLMSRKRLGRVERFSAFYLVGIMNEFVN